MPKPFVQKQVIQTFNRAAATYASAIALPKETGLRLVERLDLIRLQPEIIVELGCATGYLSKLLTQRYRHAKVFGVDIAINMVLQAKRQTRRLFSRERFVCADANRLPFADQSVDLVFSNLMLAWCNDIDALLLELRRVLKPNGLFLFTTLGPDTLQELKHCWHNIDHHLHVHPFLDMHDIGDSLVKAKFLDPVMDMEKLIFNYSQLQLLMRDLKALGMHNIAAEKNKSLTTPRQLQKLNQAYENYRTATAMLPVTFEVIYGHAWSHDLPLSTTTASGEVIIPITKIKKKA